MWRLSEHNPVQCAINWHVTVPRGTQSGRMCGGVCGSNHEESEPNSECYKMVSLANFGYKVLRNQSRIQSRFHYEERKYGIISNRMFLPGLP